MRYEILGPLRVSEHGVSSFLSAPKVEVVLATLLIRADQVVAGEELITEIWGESVPRRANAGLHVYISQLRKFLRCAGRPGDAVVTQPPGYMLRLDGDEFDLIAFEHLMKAGRGHAREGRHEEAVCCLGDALSLWRGPVLDRVRHGPMAECFVAWLTEGRLECIEILVDSRLVLGHHRELVGQLYSLIAEYPLREAFYRQLMLALYRSERQADALRVYHAARAMLNNELGLEPCRALQDTQRAILRADAWLDDLPPRGTPADRAMATRRTRRRADRGDAVPGQSVRDDGRAAPNVLAPNDSQGLMAGAFTGVGLMAGADVLVDGWR